MNNSTTKTVYRFCGNMFPESVILGNFVKNMLKTGDLSNISLSISRMDQYAWK